MSSGYEAVRITERLFWVGAIDWDLRDFHGYSTSRGTTYNAYLLTGEENVLFDTVKEPFYDQMISRISSVLPPSSITTVVSNHAEMDHSGSLPRLLRELIPGRILASEAGIRHLGMQMGIDGSRLTRVKDGETLKAGDLDLTFLETRMLHWPDSMFTWIPAMRTLVSQDAFGMHLATPRLLACENDPVLLRQEAARYYGNILLPYSGLVLKLLEKVTAMGLEFDLVLPDHGPWWKAGTSLPPAWIAGLYASWARLEPTDKAVVVYDTMWHSTEEMARAVVEGIAAGGARPAVFPLKGSHRSDIAAELLEAGALVLGSPTLNNGIFPTVADVVTYLKGLRRTGLVGAAFGSYGWSGESPRLLGEALTALRVEQVGPPLSVQFRPVPGDLENCRQLGLQVAARIAAPGARKG
jgi:flavorubredoxin